MEIEVISYIALNVLTGFMALSAMILRSFALGFGALFVYIFGIVLFIFAFV